VRLSPRPDGAGASGVDGGAWCGELADVAPAGRGSDPTGGAACGAAPDWDGGRPESSTRARVTHGAAAWGDAPSSSRCGPRRAPGKVRGGEDVRWRACVAVWGAK
jgi:hypothetical protein